MYLLIIIFFADYNFGEGFEVDTNDWGTIKDYTTSFRQKGRFS